MFKTSDRLKSLARLSSTSSQADSAPISTSLKPALFIRSRSSSPTAAALRKAQELGLDLVLIAPTAVPPVAKAIDYGHYQYEQKKKQHDAKKKQHVVQVKELKFRPNTDDHDYDFKMNHAIRFLAEGNRVKAVVQFRGREI